VFWAWNENLLLLSPLSLLLVILLPAALLAGRAVRRARVVAGIVVGMAIAALALSMTPAGQPNLEIVALILPVHVALAFALFLYLPRRSTPAPASKG
jgi:xanthine/uracil permease